MNYIFCLACFIGFCISRETYFLLAAGLFAIAGAIELKNIQK